MLYARLKGEYQGLGVESLYAPVRVLVEDRSLCSSDWTQNGTLIRIRMRRGKQSRKVRVRSTS
jgi:hypothetical protein